MTTTGEPVETLAADEVYTSTEREFEMYKEIKRLASILTKVDDFLKEKHLELLLTTEKMKLFDGTADGLDTGPKEGSHPSSYNLDADLKAESERKPAVWREDQREGNPLCTDTSMVASHTRQGTVMSAKEILKNKGDRTKFQNDATLSKFPSSNQPDKKVEDISKSSAEKCSLLPFSNEESHKLLLLALESSDTSKKMSDSKLQKCLFDSAKQLKLKELKYDSHPSMRQCLFQSFYNQLVSVWSSVESFDGILLADHSGAPNKALFRLLLTYADNHYKMII